MNNPAHSKAVLNCSGNANRAKPCRTVLNSAELSRTTQWKSAIKRENNKTMHAYIVGMHDIIGPISESADNGFKYKYRLRPGMNLYADMYCR